MDLLTGLLLEMGLLTFLGVLYYFYQKRKILAYEANKEPIIMGQILQACLYERGEEEKPAMDAVITALDDYLHNRSSSSPKALLTQFAGTRDCSPELADVIREGLREIDAKE